MFIRVVAAIEWSQREGRKANTEGGGLEASIHTDVTQTGGSKKPQERQQQQPRRQVKVKQKPKPNPAPTPTPTPCDGSHDWVLANGARRVQGRVTANRI